MFERNEIITVALTVAFRTGGVCPMLYSCTPVPFDDFIVNCLNGSSDRGFSCPWKSLFMQNIIVESAPLLHVFLMPTSLLRECLPTKHRPVIHWRRWSTHDEDPSSHILNFDLNAVWARRLCKGTLPHLLKSPPSPRPAASLWSGRVRLWRVTSCINGLSHKVRRHMLRHTNLRLDTRRVSMSMRRTSFLCSAMSAFLKSNSTTMRASAY